IPPTLWLCGQYTQVEVSAKRQEPRTKNQEPRAENQEPRTKNQEPSTQDLGLRTRNLGLRTQDSSLITHNVPFVAQEDFDLLLWCADVLWVRGEDSLARALWAGKPFVWHIYPQAEQAHHAKLRAWLRHYAATFPAALHSAYVDVHLAWNGVTSADELSSAWQRLMTQWGEWQAHSLARSAHFAQMPDLASRLMNFVTK
ncbi:MAG: elongation factor P maturation arginine rhamnosyltransferase EarP, partial [Anaerolineae bacterium]|nr:elongation factor P maturation arginine rhamnosyltransferase EarP [Anaerolineae bacterium]